MKKGLSASLFALCFLSALVSFPGIPSAQGEKKITDVRVVGTRKLSENYIISILGIRAGDYVSEDRINEWEKKLKKLSAVENVIIRAFPSEKENEVRIFIVISERATKKLSPEISRGLNNKWSFGLSYSDTDFRGKDERVKLKGLFGGTTLLEALWGKEATYRINHVGFIFKLRYSDYTYVFKDYSGYLLDDRIKNIEGSLEISTRPLESLKLTLAAGVDLYDLADPMLKDQGTKDVPDAPGGTFSILEYGFEVNTLDRLSYPEAGFLIKATRKDWGVFERNSRLKNFQYRLKGAGAFHAGKTIVSLRANSVLTGGRAPLMLIQHMGGESTVRGYEFGSISGPSSVLATAELHLPLNFSDLEAPSNPKVLTDVHIFLDTGACWDRERELKKEDFYSGFGVGLSFISNPSTVLLVEYAWTLNSSGRWQIDIRSSF